MDRRTSISRPQRVITAICVLICLVTVALHQSPWSTGFGVAGLVSGIAFLASARRH